MQSLVRTQRRLFFYNSSSSSFTQRLQFFQSAAGFCNQSEIENQAPPPRPEEDYDVVIVGGGMVGAAVGCGLASSAMTRGLRVAMIDSSPKQPTFRKHDPNAIPDQRVSAITPATVRFFQDVGAWEGVLSARPTPFDSMQVWDYGGLGFTRYKAEDVGEPLLGYVVENNVLLAALHSCLQSVGSIETMNPAQVKSVMFPSSSNLSPTQTKEAAESNGKQDWAQIELADGRRLRTRLVVGADGGKSAVRSMAGFQTRGWQYKQTAVICTVKVEWEHTTAWQRFLPTGPFALLPMGGTFSNIVWSTSPEIAQELKLMPSVDFVVEANRALLEDYGSQPYSGLAELLSSGLGKQLFGSELGTQLLGAFTPSSAEQFQVPPRVMDCVTERLSFPLSLLHATKYVNHRVALVGDAAHTVHPLAGQGVNLGFGDALALVNTLHRGVEGGFDIGEERVLKEYENERKKTNMTMMALLDGFQKLYATDFGPLNIARAAGFNTVNLLGPLKKQIITYAMGVH